jgi:hypothetical protein
MCSVQGRSDSTRAMSARRAGFLERGPRQAVAENRRITFRRRAFRHWSIDSRNSAQNRIPVGGPDDVMVTTGGCTAFYRPARACSAGDGSWSPIRSTAGDEQRLAARAVPVPY